MAVARTYQPLRGTFLPQRPRGASFTLLSVLALLPASFTSCGSRVFAAFAGVRTTGPPVRAGGVKGSLLTWGSPESEVGVQSC